MQLKFLCVNLWHSVFLDELIDFIRHQQADVIALQEVFDGKEATWDRKYRTMDILRKELAYPHDDFSASFLECLSFGKVPEGNAILSRLPITHSETSFFNMRQKTHPGFATAVVDMIFVSPNIRVVEHTCHQVNISDHLPLSAVIAVP